MSTNTPPAAMSQVAFRLPTQLIDRIDRQVKRLSGRYSGVRVTRADVVRQLLVRALADAERER